MLATNFDQVGGLIKWKDKSSSWSLTWLLYSTRKKIEVGKIRIENSDKW